MSKLNPIGPDSIATIDCTNCKIGFVASWKELTGTLPPIDKTGIFRACGAVLCTKCGQEVIIKVTNEAS